MEKRFIRPPKGTLKSLLRSFPLEDLEKLHRAVIGKKVPTKKSDLLDALIKSRKLEFSASLFIGRKVKTFKHPSQVSPGKGFNQQRHNVMRCNGRPGIFQIDEERHPEKQYLERLKHEKDAKESRVLMPIPSPSIKP